MADLSTDSSHRIMATDWLASFGWRATFAFFILPTVGPGPGPREWSQHRDRAELPLLITWRYVIGMNLACDLVIAMLFNLITGHGLPARVIDYLAAPGGFALGGVVIQSLRMVAGLLGEGIDDFRLQRGKSPRPEPSNRVVIWLLTPGDYDLPVQLVLGALFVMMLLSANT